MAPRLRHEIAPRRAREHSREALKLPSLTFLSLYVNLYKLYLLALKVMDRGIPRAIDLVATEEELQDLLAKVSSFPRTTIVVISTIPGERRGQAGRQEHRQHGCGSVAASKESE